MRQDDIPEVDLSDYALAVSGLVRDKAPWTLEGLRKLPQRTDITRLVCVEGWSAGGVWLPTAASGANQVRLQKPQTYRRDIRQQ